MEERKSNYIRQKEKKNAWGMRITELLSTVILQFFH